MSWSEIGGDSLKAKFSQEAAVFDCLYALGPQVFSCRLDSTVVGLVNLRGLEKYWQLDTFPNVLEIHNDPLKKQQAQNLQHVFLDKLNALQDRFCDKDFHFVLAPSSVWARALCLLLPRKRGVSCLSLPQIMSEVLPHCSPMSLKFLIDDLSSDSVSRDLEFRFFCEALKDFDFANAAQLLVELKKNRGEYSQRFGSLMSPLCKRAYLESDDYRLDTYVPLNIFEHVIDLSWENQTGLSSEEDLLKRVSVLFDDWQFRAESRRLLFRSVDVVVKSERRAESVSQKLSMARPSRESKTWCTLFREFWVGSKDQKQGLMTEYPDEISELVLRTSVLENDRDIQLNLFNPEEEELSEKWHSLVARLHARAVKSSQVRVGTYVPQASFVPEKAVCWKEWSDVSENLAMVPEYPLRPQLLLLKPLEFCEKTLSDYEEFLFFVESKNAISSLEKISNPWGAKGHEERSYARVEEKWIYWDHLENAAYLHGFFEN